MSNNFKKSSEEQDCPVVDPVVDINDAQLKQLSCVVVEDALFVREIFRIVLRKTHVQIKAEVSDGVEALIKLAEIKPDIVLLDLVLPLKSGFEVLKEIERVSPKSKVIVVTSLEEDSFEKKALALGALKYLRKPFTKLELLKAIDEASRSYGVVLNG